MKAKRFYFKFGIFFFSLLSLQFSKMHNVYAQDGLNKYRNWSPIQVSEMPKEKRSKEMPIAYIWAAQEGLSTGHQLSIGMKLNNLMYPGIENYEKAVKMFQADLNEEDTGHLTVGQIFDLGERHEVSRLERVSFPSDQTSFITKGYASVKGTLKIIDDNIATPVNHVEIHCYKSQESCEFDMINLAFPSEKGFGKNFLVYKNSTEYYKVISWTKNNIEAIPTDRDAENCRKLSLSLDFSTKEFYYITKNGVDNCKTLTGVEFDRLEKPRIAQLVDGEKIFNEAFGKLKKKAFSYYSSKFQDEVEKLLEQTKKKNN